MDPARAMKILLLDDEPFVLKLLGRQLANLGCGDSHCFENATAALAALEADPAAFDLVFCDLQMPVMDGVEFLRHLARIGFRGGLILISGEDSRILETAERLAQVHHLKVLGALRKPTTPEHLRMVLEHFDSTATPAAVPGPPVPPEAIARAIDNGELINHYQPKVLLATGELAGVEALVRWDRPGAGLVYPDRFIATAEQHGLIDRLTQVVLANALAQTRRWLDAGLDLHVAVNISMDNLEDLTFADRVAQAVAAAAVPPSRLVLEVTESQLMRDPAAPLDILARLRLRQVGLSIDDFGTGHSSLVKLRDFPFSELKIDRGFTHGAGRDRSLRSILEASLEMARQLAMRTVAEGVEDREDWEMLATTSCDLAQGYFIGRPMPASELHDWMADWAHRRHALLEKAT